MVTVGSDLYASDRRRRRRHQRLERAERDFRRADVRHLGDGRGRHDGQHRDGGDREHDRAAELARQHGADRRDRPLDMATLLNAVATLRLNAVPEIDGAYNCYLDPVSAKQLFGDQAFRQLFTGATSANQVFKRGMVNDFLGLRFMPTTEAYVTSRTRRSSAGLIRRPDRLRQGRADRGRLRRHGGGRRGAEGLDRLHRRRRRDGDARADRPAAADHRAVLVLDRRVLHALRHHDQPDDDPDRDQRRVQARGDGGARRLSRAPSRRVPSRRCGREGTSRQRPAEFAMSYTRRQPRSPTRRRPTSGATAATRRMARAPSGFQGWRFFQAYGLLEYRLNNLSDAEVAVVTNYLATLAALEVAITEASSRLDTSEAAVWTRNPYEVRERAGLFDDWRRRLCAFMGLPPGPGLGDGTLALVV